jgi:RNA polymerase sigma-70 factor (ECF subfamily)
MRISVENRTRFLEKLKKVVGPTPRGRLPGEFSPDRCERSTMISSDPDTDESSFTTVMSRLRAGDEHAAGEVFQRYVHRLIALASRQFDARVRSKEDPEDVVNSVLKSFFRSDDGSPYELSDWEALWRLLATITIRKCIARRQFWKAARRDVGREIGPPAEPEPDWMEAIARGPTPEQAMALAEAIEQILSQLPSDHRTIAEYYLQNYPQAEIADRCHCSERTVRRVGERIRELLGEEIETQT